MVNEIIRTIESGQRLLAVQASWGFSLVILLALASGCRHAAPAPVAAIGPQAGLVRAIADADRVVLTNRWASSSEQELNFTVGVSGGKLDAIVRAIASAQPLTNVSTYCMYDWQLQFFKGTNCLGQLGFQGEFFRDHEAEYMDGTRTLERL